MATPSLTSMTSNSAATRFQWRVQRSYYAEVPARSLDEQSQLVDQVIRFALDTLGAYHLDVRVCAARDTPCALAHHELVSTTIA